ncbi:MAG: DUF169 domain-containing protein [Candidatus Rokubacteria bacterium]|nr:DUF169 domain-containing protein [Candidatus Rokubacteria bacterium]
MIDYRALEQQLTTTLGLTRPPVAVAFRDAPPAGVAKFAGQEPSGCSFWRVAAGGRAFYTVPSDHHNCVIGSHTHNIPPSPERARELPEMLEFLTSIGYLRLDEVPGIPQLPTTPGTVVYAPLGATPVDPDVVLFAGRPGRLMLLQEAALRAGVGVQLPALGRPTCMALPAALTHGLVTSTGCIGNRVYTDLGDDELYVAVAGKDLARIAAEAETIAAANARLLAHHRERRQTLATE